MRLAVLGNPDSWYFHDLKRAAEDRHELVALPFSELRGEITPTGLQVCVQDQVLNDYDAVLVRTMPPGSLEQVVMRMDCLLELAASGTVVLNSPRALETAVDKFLTSAKLRRANIPTPNTIVCQTWEAGMAAFEKLGSRAVVKPVFGGEGRGITRFDDPALAERAFKMLTQLGAVLYLQEFIEHDGSDLRLLVLGKKIWGMKRSNALDWRTNASRGATTEPIEVTAALADLAMQSAAAVGAEFAGVDVVFDPVGNPSVLEVNAVPGWKALARTLQVDVTAELLHYLEAKVAQQPQPQQGRAL